MEKIKKIAILGATGGCVDILDTINYINSALPKPKYECIGFLDDNPSLRDKKVLNIKVLGPFNLAGKLSSDSYFVTGIGSSCNFWKKGAIIYKLDLPLNRFETIVHPTANLSSTARLGLGSVIYQHVTITRNVQIGNHVLVLPSAVVSHDDIIGDYTIINAGVCISGEVKVGKSCYIGTNSAIKENVIIGDYCLIGMGSVVLHDIPDNSVVVGNPATFLRRT